MWVCSPVLRSTSNTVHSRLSHAFMQVKYSRWEMRAGWLNFLRQLLRSCRSASNVLPSDHTMSWLSTSRKKMPKFTASTSVQAGSVETQHASV